VRLGWVGALGWLIPAALGAASPLFPDRLICAGDPGRLQLVTAWGKGAWDFGLEGPALDAQSQPSGDWLVTGGKGKLFLLHHSLGQKPWVVGWDWSKLEVDPPADAVAVDWDLSGKPTLILAADAVKKRLFLAEAKAAGAKIRWEFPLPDPPRAVKVCPDSGNFLVTLDSQVEEVDFKQAKVLWSLKVDQAAEAVRSPDSTTYVIDQKGRVSAYDIGQNRLWQASLDPVSDEWKNANLSLFEVREEIRILASGSARTRQGRQGREWVLDSKNGKILAMEACPSLVTRVVPRIEGMGSAGR